MIWQILACVFFVLAIVEACAIVILTAELDDCLKQIDDEKALHDHMNAAARTDVM